VLKKSLQLLFGGSVGLQPHEKGQQIEWFSPGFSAQAANAFFSNLFGPRPFSFQPQLHFFSTP
jgi:hypothetical protein